MEQQESKIKEILSRIEEIQNVKVSYIDSKNLKLTMDTQLLSSNLFGILPEKILEYHITTVSCSSNKASVHYVVI